MAAQQATRSERPRGILWPLLLIVFGVILLLNNFGYLSWTVWWNLARLWPVLLIALGVEIIFRRSNPVLASIVATALVLGALIVAIASPTQAFFNPIAAGPTQHEVFDVPLDANTSGDVSITTGIGTLNLGVLPAGSANLLHVDANLLPGEHLQRTVSTSNGVAVVSLSEQGNNQIIPPFGARGGSDQLLWNVQLSPKVPLTLRTRLGVGQSKLDLTNLNVRDFQLDAGVGNSTIDFPNNAGQTSATIHGGVGRLVLQFPAGVGARITTSNGIGGVTVDKARFQQNGNVYQTANYGTAKNRVDVTLNMGVGSVEIR